MINRKNWSALGLSIACALSLSTATQAQPACSNRGELDQVFCDADRDLVADAPAVRRNPTQLVIGVSAVEDRVTALKTYTPLIDHLRTCLKRDVVMNSSVGESRVLEGMRKGDIHLGQFATGGTMYAVNFAGAVPFASKGSSKIGKHDGYTLMLIVRADSPYKTLQDLKGKQIAHTTATSNSGNLAPRALFPEKGLTPEKDYKVTYSGKHDNSIVGVANGLYDGAAIASDVLSRMVTKGEIKSSQFRVLYESPTFPPDAFSMAHDLDAKLGGEIRKCFGSFRFSETMSKLLEGNDRFYPINYEQDWNVVRTIFKSAGSKMTREAYQEIVNKKP